MKLGIFTKTFEGHTPLAVLSAARGAGYETVQYNMASSGLSSLPPVISAGTAEAVQAASAETGVTIAAVSATYNMIHPDVAEREKGRRSFGAIAASLARIGTRLLTVCTGSCDPYDQWRYHPDNSSPAAWEEMCREFRLILPIAEREDILIGVEPELANVISSAQRARELIDTFNNDRIKIVFDPANLFQTETLDSQRLLIEAAADMLGDSIVLAHAKDRLSNGSFVAAGAGVLDYRHYLGVMRKVGFNGALIAHELATNKAERVAQFLTREIAAVETGR